jgi:hypothetical protein
MPGTSKVHGYVPVVNVPGTSIQIYLKVAGT